MSGVRPPRKASNSSPRCETGMTFLLVSSMDNITGKRKEPLGSRIPSPGRRVSPSMTRYSADCVFSILLSLCLILGAAVLLLRTKHFVRFTSMPGLSLALFAATTPTEESSEADCAMLVCNEASLAPRSRRLHLEAGRSSPLQPNRQRASASAASYRKLTRPLAAERGARETGPELERTPVAAGLRRFRPRDLR
jgi:hypothetical protein